MKEKTNLTMLCDFYELTMGNGYFQTGLGERICYFDVFFRSVPDQGGFAIAAGLAQVIEYIQKLRFDEEDIAYLRSKGCFAEPFLDYLRQFRGMNVDSGQIIVGAGTEFLYSLLIQLLGREKCYAVEDPGYSKIAEIYRSHQVDLRRVGLDEKGLSTRLLRRQEADIVHLSPSHHYPTGIVMPIGRLQELLRWAEEQEGRWILEDDYDSEFRFVGRPIPTLFSIDEAQRVIYLNTFSKTIAPSIRISYMILPPRLMEVYREKLGFYACTVSGFEQYTLAKFMAQGRYEQHLSRMKARYRQKRDAVIAMLRSSPLADRVEIMEQDAGLHFLVRLDTRLPDAALRSRAAEQGVRLALLSDYYSARSSAPQHIVVVNYSGIDLERLPEGLRRLAQAWEE